MSHVPRFVVLALSLSFATSALAADPAALVAAKRALQAGVSHAKPDEILRAKASFAALLAAEPQSSALNYWLALADWRAEPLVLQADRDEARKLCKEGIAACDRALAARPKMADAIALKASLQGLSLTFVPSAGPTLGPEMDEAFGRAEGMEGGNPRVVLFKAIGTLHKPKFVNGGPDRAKPQFERALALFDKAPAADSTTIDWGHDDALLWSGQCLGQLGEWGAARARYRAALALNPDNAWVKYVLLPQAEKALAAVPDTTAAHGKAEKP